MMCGVGPLDGGMENNLHNDHKCLDFSGLSGLSGRSGSSGLSGLYNAMEEASKDA